MEIKFVGGKQFVINHRGHQIISDQPVESGGEDKGMTPPELLVGALGSCIAIYLVNYCVNAKIPHEGMNIEVFWEKAKDPSRIKSVKVDIEMPGDLSEGRKKALIRVAEHCTIHNTLVHTPEINIDIECKVGE